MRASVEHRFDVTRMVDEYLDALSPRRGGPSRRRSTADRCRLTAPGRASALSAGDQLLARPHRHGLVEDRSTRPRSPRTSSGSPRWLRLGPALPALGGLPAGAGRVDRVMLRRLVAVADLAERAGIGIMPTLFTGHMSGVNWIPGWALGGLDRDHRFRVLSGGGLPAGLRNWYADAEVARRRRSWPARPRPRWPATRRCGRGISATRTRTASRPPTARPPGTGWSRCPRRSEPPMTPRSSPSGLHMEDLEEDRKLGPAEAADDCDFLTMHGYPIYARWAEGGTDEHLLPFLADTRWLGGGLDVLFSEFGLPTYRGRSRCRTGALAERVAARRGAGRGGLHGRALGGPRAGRVPWRHAVVLLRLRHGHVGRSAPRRGRP